MQKKKANRAEIFLSFDSLKGFKEYIDAKNQKTIERKQLSADSMDELNWKIKLIEPGKMITVVFYENGKYLELTGMVSSLDDRILTVVDKLIHLDDILSISGEGIDDMMYMD